MEIAHGARTVQIILQIVLRSGPDAYLANIAVRIDLLHKGKPRFARRWTVD